MAAIFANGDLAAYDLNGKLAWSKSFGIPVNPYGHAASLTIYNDLLVVPFDQGEVKAKKSKLRAGHSQRPAGLGGGPPGEGLLDDAHRGTCGRPRSIDNNRRPLGDRLQPGRRQGAVAGEAGPRGRGPSPVLAGDVVIAIVDDNSPFVAIRPDGSGDVTAKCVLWKGTDNMPAICSPLATAEFVFVLTSEGKLTCYDTKNGDKLWEEDLGEFNCKSSPAMVGKVLFLFGEDGKCWVLEPSRHGVKRVRQTKLGDGSVACPAFQDGRMYVRGKESLFCIGKAK